MACTHSFKESVTVTQILDLVILFWFMTHLWVMIHVCVKYHETDLKTFKITPRHDLSLTGHCDPDI